MNFKNFFAGLFLIGILLAGYWFIRFDSLFIKEVKAQAACGSQIAGSYKYRVLKEGNDVNVCDINNAKVYSNTDASASIQWAINNLTPSRSTQEKVVTQTDLTINSTISPKSFVYLEIRGILRMGGFNYDLINFSDQHDITIAGPVGGYGELIGQGKTVGTTGWGIRTQGSGSKNQNIIFKNLKAHDFRQSGIALNKLSGGTGLVENCICNNNGQNGIGFGDSTGVISKNNYAEGNRDAGVQFEDVWNFQVTDNQCIANGRHNLQIEHGVGGQIVNGKYNNGVGDGIQIRNRVPPDAGISENITVSGVEAKNNATDGLIVISSQNITVQSGIFSNNGANGIRFNDSTGDGSVKNNTADIITHNNGARGFWLENSTITNISGSMIACSNAASDLTLLGTSNTFNVYHYAGSPAPVISKGSNTVNVIDFTCNPKSVSGIWAVDKICAVGGICGVPAVSPAPTPSPSGCAAESFKYKVVNEGGTANVYNSSNVKDTACSSSNHSDAIQCTLDKLAGGKIVLDGNFIINNTIFLPSNITWKLCGKITLGNNINKIVIADPPSGATNINMSGGTYDGNKANQLASAADDHVIKFSKVMNSHFADMTVQNAVNDNFTLDTGSNNNTVDRVIGRWAGTGSSTTNDGNGLDDKGDHNTWTDCIAEDNYSDNWVIKSRNSTFIRCIGRGSTQQVAFGLFADRDVTGNVFQDCKGYTNGTTAIVYNIPDKSLGKRYKIEGNSFQGEMYNNGHNGVTLTNSTTDGVIRNNTFDLLLHDNAQSGFVIKGGGITGNSGPVIACNNPVSAMMLAGGGNAFNLYHYAGSPAPVISKGSNTVNVIDFTCNPKSVSGIWAVDKVCAVGGICGVPAVSPAPSPTPSPASCSSESFTFKVLNEGGTANVYNSSSVKDACSNTDHSAAIQCVLDKLAGGKILLIGDFIAKNTIYLPSNITWKLCGKIKLGNNVNKDLITNKDAVNTNITMSGGIYDGNLSDDTGFPKNNLNQNKEYRVIDFTQITNSHFSDMIAQNGGKGLTIGRGSSGNTFDRITGRNNGTGKTTGGNGLGDRGDHNIWNDSIAENNWSDNFIIKSRYSTYNRCIARNSAGKVGFGIYARMEGQDQDTGEEVIGNKFYACEAYGNAHAGFSINNGTTAPNAKVEDNFIQISLHDNNKLSDVTQGAMNFRNAVSSGTIRNNVMDILTCKDGNKGGLYYDTSFINKITGNTGSVISYDNASAYDIDIVGNGNSYNLYHPTGMPAQKVSKGSNTVNVIDFTCNPKSVSGIWAVDTYCQLSGICGAPVATPFPTPSSSPFPSTSPSPSSSPTVTTLDIPFVPPLLINGVQNLVDTIINWLLGLASLIVILFLIIGGVMYFGSSGDEERINQAKKIITYTIVGLIIILISYSVFNVLVKMIWG